MQARVALAETGQAEVLQAEADRRFPLLLTVMPRAGLRRGVVFVYYPSEVDPLTTADMVDDLADAR
jgi:hypothetical protein